MQALWKDRLLSSLAALRSSIVGLWKRKLHALVSWLPAFVSSTAVWFFCISITLNFVLLAVIATLAVRLTVSESLLTSYKENRDLRVQYDASVMRYCDIEGKIADSCQRVLGQLTDDLGLNRTAPTLAIMRTLGPYVPPVASVGGPGPTEGELPSEHRTVKRDH